MVTRTAPSTPIGARATTAVALRLTMVAFWVPKTTFPAVARFLPVNVTSVPPAKVPLAGETRDSVGAATNV